jgi:hypothetical protein
MNMSSRDTRCELCCFAATCLAAGTFVLAICALEFSLEGPTPATLYLLVAAGIAFVLTIVFTALAVEMERKAPLTGAQHVAKHDTQRGRGESWR